MAKKDTLDLLYPDNLYFELPHEEGSIPPEDFEERLEFVMRTIPSRECAALLGYFRDRKTLEEIGKEMRLSRERVRQLRQRALMRLRLPICKVFLTYGVRDGSRRVMAAKREVEAELERNLRRYEQEMEPKDNELRLPTGFQNDTPIDILVSSYGLSIVARDALKRNGIHTIGELCKMGEEEISKLKGVGKLRMESIHSAMDSAGLGCKANSRQVPAFVGMESRARNLLAGAGIYKIRQLCSKTEKDLSKIPGFGDSSLHNVRGFLYEHGLYLKDEGPGIYRRVLNGKESRRVVKRNTEPMDLALAVDF